MYYICLLLTCVKKVSNTDGRHLLWNLYTKTLILRKIWTRLGRLTIFQCLKIRLECSWNTDLVETYLLLIETLKAVVIHGLDFILNSHYRQLYERDMNINIYYVRDSSVKGVKHYIGIRFGMQYTFPVNWVDILN